MTQSVIVDISRQHYEEILRLNRDNVEMLSPLDEQGLDELVGMADMARTVLVDGKVAAFVIALREGSRYQSVNYKWFSERLERFLYVDRVVVAEGCRHASLGTQLYAEVFAKARLQQLPAVTAEINIEPENRPSLLFHKKMGFVEQGTQPIDGGKKVVSMQVACL